jgi:WD40 repeat protein
MKANMRKVFATSFALCMILSFRMATSQEELPPLNETTAAHLTHVATLPIGDTLQIEVSDDERILVYGSEGSGLLILDQASDEIIKNLPIATDSLSLSGDGSLLAVAGADLVVEEIQYISLEPSKSLPLTSSSTKTMFIEQDQKLLLADVAGVFHLFRPDPLEKLYSWNAHTGAILDFLYLESSQLIISYGEDAHLKLWNTTGELLRDFGGLSNIVSLTAMDESHLAAVKENGELPSMICKPGLLSKARPRISRLTKASMMLRMRTSSR